MGKTRRALKLVALAAILGLTADHTVIVLLEHRRIIASNYLQLSASLLAVCLCVIRAGAAKSPYFRRLWLQLSSAFAIWSIAQIYYVAGLLLHWPQGRRRGLQDLLDIVESGIADFSSVVVYDVSRWGRFPDTDESAHYEFVCKRAGISVRYCAEQFENDNSPTSNLLKALKRTMASEYSRELSVKVSAGQRRLASMGFWQGGNAPFGMMRQLVDMNRNPKSVLRLGEWKSISTDRILLTPGPPEAVATVKLAYDLYTERGRNRYQIAEILNKAKKFRGRTPWTIVMLRELFIDPIYKGAYAYGKMRFAPAPPSGFRRTNGLFEKKLSPQSSQSSNGTKPESASGTRLNLWSIPKCSMICGGSGNERVG